MNSWKIAALLLALVVAVDGAAQNMTIDWHSKSCHFVTRGGYARIRKVDNRHALVYGSGASVWIRFSDDCCEQWSEAVEVARGEGYIYTNSELLQLQSGRLLFMWNARPRKGTALPYKIMYATSDDGGCTWSRGHDLYTAGNVPREGCWEPVALQLPSGEVHIYFANEAPYKASAEQDISLVRSTDECRTWSRAERVSFRAGSRDGMPVPIYLPHTGQIAVAIEDNGLRGTFKPVIVRTANNWKDGCVTADDPRREAALAPRWALRDSIYAGAPYLIRLGERHTLLAVQSTEGRQGRGHKYANMQVYVGDKSARNFRNRSTPMPDLAAEGCALWNSLAAIDDRTVVAVMSVSRAANGQNGVWTVKGTLVKAKR